MHTLTFLTIKRITYDAEQNLLYRLKAKKINEDRDFIKSLALFILILILLLRIRQL